MGETVLGEDAFRELHARVVIAPRPELRLTQSVDPHADSSDTTDVRISRKPVSTPLALPQHDSGCDVVTTKDSENSIEQWLPITIEQCSRTRVDCRACYVT